MIYTITVINLNDTARVEVYDNEEDYGYNYADYCGFGYYATEWRGHAIVEQREGV